MPKNIRSRAKGLLLFIQKYGGNNLQIQGNRVYMNGKQYGHVIDFLRSAVSAYPIKSRPKGMTTFLSLLKKINTPMYFTPKKFNLPTPQIKKIPTPKMELPGKRIVNNWVKLSHPQKKYK